MTTVQVPNSKDQQQKNANANANVNVGGIKNDDVMTKPERAPNHFREITLPKDENGFYTMPEDGLRYSPDECGDVPLVGHLVGAVRRKSQDFGEFIALSVHTALPTKAITIDGEVRQVGVQQKVDIVATEKLKQYIRYAMHPSKCFLVRIKPLKKVKVGRGTMWTYEVALHETVARRPSFYPVINQDEAARAAGAIAGGGGAVAGALPAASDDGEIPF